MSGSLGATCQAQMSARRLRLVLAPDAKADLAEILLYTQQRWGKQQRAAYKASIDGALREMAEFPGLGRTRDEISSGLRSFPIGSHVIYYRATDEQLIVARIVHSSRDFSDDGSALGRI